MFSVVIPAYNCEKTICLVLDSVLNQTRFDLIDEIVLINDGSNDRTAEAIKAYLNAHPDSRILYREQENHGVSYTRNVGINLAVGEWIALLDADDTWHTDKMERQYEILKNNPRILFLGADCPIRFLFTKYQTGLHKLTARQICIRTCPPTPSIVFKKSVGIELGLFDENNSQGEDLQFYQKFLTRDSYYVLAEKLVDLSVGKQYFGESGLTSNLRAMAKGRDRDAVELYHMKLISLPFLLLILLFNKIKFCRRMILHRAHQIMVKQGKE